VFSEAAWCEWLAADLGAHPHLVPTVKSDPPRVLLNADDGDLARIAVVLDEDLSPSFAIDFFEASARVDEAADAAVDAIVRVAKTAGVATTRIRSTAATVRDAARLRGYEGPLRGTLCRTGATEPRAILAELEAMLPGVSLHLVTQGRAARALSRSRAGLRDATELVVHAPGTSEFHCTMPGEDLMVELVARVIDITIAVRRRFPHELEGMRSVRLDVASRGNKTGRVGGEAQLAAAIHLNAAFLTRAGLARLRTQAQARRPSNTRSATVPGIYNAVDGTTAHELWHQIEGSFQAGRYRDSIEFRRRLGEFLGVDTLEHAFHPGTPSHDQLVRDVSGYAGTRAFEATAEMFKLWWCRGESCAPTVAFFGELLDEFFPQAV